MGSYRSFGQLLLDIVGILSKSSVSADLAAALFGVRINGVFRRTNGDGVVILLEGVIRGLGVNNESRTPIRLLDANRFAAGDIDANRSNVDRMYGDAIFLRASNSFAFCSRIRSPAFTANAWPIDSRLDVSAMKNDGPPIGRVGVSDPSKRNGVPSSSPQVINGLSATPGCGDGVFTKLNAWRLPARTESARVLPSTPTRLTMVLL